jgi:hypothetical protein
MLFAEQDQVIIRQERRRSGVSAPHLIGAITHNDHADQVGHEPLLLASAPNCVSRRPAHERRTTR